MSNEKLMEFFEAKIAMLAIRTVQSRSSISSYLVPRIHVYIFLVLWMTIKSVFPANMISVNVYRSIPYSRRLKFHESHLSEHKVVTINLVLAAT